jgi:hypothetical protein
MSCYFRHMKEVFEEAGITITPENKKLLDQALHQITGVNYKDCSAAWKTLKHNFLADETKRSELVQRLKAAAL